MASVLVLLLFLFPCFVTARTGDDSIYIRKLKLQSCRNTIQGRSLLADENGYICRIQEIDRWTGCCTKAQDQFQCLGCNLTSRCCNSYEYCVSCCLHPNRTSKDVATKVKLARHASSGTYKDTFDFCMGRCRHDSQSVVHENAYATEDHHCFSLPTNSSSEVATPVAVNDLGGISIVIGRLGQSCEVACRLNGQICQPSKLAAINKCSTLQKYFSCRGPCVASIDQPAEISPSAPRQMHPGACLLSTQDTGLSCGGSNVHTRRLCPCA